MKKLISTARNITHSIHEGKLYTEIEAVLGVQEPRPKYVGGQLVHFKVPCDIRFAMNIETAEILVADLARWIDEAKQQAASIGIKEVSE